MNRPLCRRCNKPMTVWREPAIDGEGERIRWACDIQVSDETFWKEWNKLTGDEVAALERHLMELDQPGVV